MIYCMAGIVLLTVYSAVLTFHIILTIEKHNTLCRAVRDMNDKLETKLAERNQYIEELEGRLRVLWDKYNSALDDITADSKENSESNAIIRELQLKIKQLEEAGNAMYDFINPPSPCLRTSRMDNLLQGWDDAKANK